jgi:DNA adenine methylase
MNHFQAGHELPNPNVPARRAYGDPVNKSVTRSAIRYFGGKWAIAPWVIENMPNHEIYVEPFGGGASVLLRKPPAKFEVYNDLDSEIYGIFKVLQSSEQCQRLARMLKRTPWAREQYREAFTASTEPVVRAQRALVRAYMSIHHSALFNPGKIGGFASTDASGVRSWRNYPRALVHVTRRLKHIVLENRDAFKVIDTHDTPGTLFFVDPPYLPSTRNPSAKYRCEMTEAQHIELLTRLNAIKGRAMVAGYPSGLYDDMLKDWTRLEKSHYARSNGVRKSTEVLWITP